MILVCTTFFIEAHISTHLALLSFAKPFFRHTSKPTPSIYRFQIEMEPLEAISELTWNLPDESEVMMAQLLGAYPDMNEQDREPSLGIESIFWSDQGASSCNWLDNISSSLYWPSNSTTSTGSFFFPTSEFETFESSNPNVIPAINTSSGSTNICASEEQMTTSPLPIDSNYQFEVANSSELEDYSANPSEHIVLPDDTLLPKRKFLEPGIDNKDEVPIVSPKKKARASVQVKKSTKNSRSKKGHMSVRTGEEEESYSSENDSNAFQELNEGDGSGTSSSAKGKTRASRVSATDPQSLYARKRRERINERLRILQNLVPNGTKVDISTMLEEAVLYVKFLQLQIKLLSSDDLWMYAPLAYNGMDIGLDLKILLPQQ